MESKVIVNTKLGKVQGYNRNGINTFKGIPYAKPPIGELRFNPPVPPEPWNNIFNATKYGPICPQPVTTLTSLLGVQYKQSEADCLTLNIWAPERIQDQLPVMYWIHGGGFTTGSGAELDGTRLARRGNVIVVSINYRLGALGFLYIPDQPTNIGLLDQIEALKWVRDNIEAFGGDPNNVTLFGESAGGVAGCTLMAMPAAKGLFHRVIAQSGVAHPLYYLKSQRIKTTKEIMEKLGIEEGDIEALRNVPVDHIVKADPSTKGIESGSAYTSSTPTNGIVIDGTTLLDHPIKIISNGYAKDIELLIGTNLDEVKLYNAFNPKVPKLNENQMVKGVTKLMKMLSQDEERAKNMIDIYLKSREGKESTAPRDILDQFYTDFTFRIPAILFAEKQLKNQPNTYMYLFTWRSPVFGGKMGSYHALELPFVYGLLAKRQMGIFPRKNEETETLSNAMIYSWSSFARIGNPNNNSIPKWPSYDIEKRSTMLLGKEIKVVDGPFDEERAAWDGIFKLNN